MGTTLGGQCCQPYRHRVAFTVPDYTSVHDSSAPDASEEDLLDWCNGIGIDIGAETDTAIVESLSYCPGRFEERETVDLDRSQSRYGNVAMQRTHHRLGGKMRIREDWLLGDGAGRAITLIDPHAVSACRSANRHDRIPAMCYFDRALTTLTISYCERNELVSITIPVNSLQNIGPCAALLPLLSRFEAGLNESEKARMVLLQYDITEADPANVCFLLDGEKSKVRFVKALRVLWYERSSHASASSSERCKRKSVDDKEYS